MSRPAGAPDPEPAAPSAAAPHDTVDHRPASVALLDLRTRWSALNSTQRLRAKQASVVSVIGLVGFGLYSASRSDAPPPPPPEASRLDMGAGLRGDSLEVKINGDLKKIFDGQMLLGDRITAIEEGRVGPTTGGPGDPMGVQGADGMGSEAPLPSALPGEIPAYPPAPKEALRDVGQIPEPPMAPVAPPPPPVERQVGAIGSAAAAGPIDKDGAASKKKMRTIYLPPGFMKARLLTGVDAMASRDATSNPEPIIARVQAPAVLPNEVKANLAGCFVIGNATGSLAKERVEVQLVSLSCVDFDEHAVVDQALKGFFVDADGKKGLSGKVVTRAGATLARTFIAGTISGISQTVQGTFGDVSTSALGSVRNLDAGDAAKTGVAGGLAKSSDKLTDFYLDLARQAGPVVEVGAAKEVIVVIQEGVALEIKPAAGSRF